MDTVLDVASHAVEAAVVVAARPTEAAVVVAASLEVTHAHALKQVESATVAKAMATAAVVVVPRRLPHLHTAAEAMVTVKAMVATVPEASVPWLLAAQDMEIKMVTSPATTTVAWGHPKQQAQHATHPAPTEAMDLTVMVDPGTEVAQALVPVPPVEATVDRELMGMVDWDAVGMVPRALPPGTEGRPTSGADPVTKNHSTTTANLLLVIEAAVPSPPGALNGEEYAWTSKNRIELKEWWMGLT